MVTSLVQLSDVKDWVLSTGPGTPAPSTSDDLIQRLIGSASQMVVKFLNAPVAPATYTETYDGRDRVTLTLREQPVITVRSLTVGSQVVAARVGLTGSGYVFDQESVSLCGGLVFWRGIQNVQVVYDAGYQTSEPQLVPAAAGNALPIDDLSEQWNVDRGVAYANGTALTLVTGAPAQGQYQIGQDAQGSPTYVFNAADANAAILVTFGYTPADIAQAVIELVGERYFARDRIGVSTQSMGGHVSTAFSQKDMNAAVRTMLNPYRQVVPIA